MEALLTNRNTRHRLSDFLVQGVADEVIPLSHDRQQSPFPTSAPVTLAADPPREASTVLPACWPMPQAATLSGKSRHGATCAVPCLAAQDDEGWLRRLGLRGNIDERLRRVTVR